MRVWPAGIGADPPAGGELGEAIWSGPLAFQVILYLTEFISL